MQNTTTQWRRAKTSLKKIYLSLYSKGSVWEGVADRTELQYIDPHSHGHQRCVFLILQGCTTGSLGAHSAGCRLPLPHLSPTGLVCKVTDFLSSPSYIKVPSPTKSLEWYVWSSSSGNNCHAVHRSLSSDASVYDCTAGFYLVPYCQPSPPTPMEYALPPSLEWHVGSGRRSKTTIRFCHNRVRIICILNSYLKL